MKFKSLILVFGSFVLGCQSLSATDNPLFILGQDMESIQGFMNACDCKPDGFMVYTNLVSLDGLKHSDQGKYGAGENHAKALLEKYPDAVLNIGLYINYIYKLIPSGEFDLQIEEFGKWIQSVESDVYLRVGYEFDNPDNDLEPEAYKKAFQYIADQFRQMNVSNVKYVWHAMAWREDPQAEIDFMSWYPSDEYVDYAGVSFFDNRQNHQKLRDKFVQLVKDLNKPLMVAESSPMNQKNDDGRIQWVKDLNQFMHENDVEVLSLINANWDAMPLFTSYEFGNQRFDEFPSVMKKVQTLLLPSALKRLNQ